MKGSVLLKALAGPNIFGVVSILNLDSIIFNTENNIKFLNNLCLPKKAECCYCLFVVMLCHQSVINI